MLQEASATTLVSPRGRAAPIPDAEAPRSLGAPPLPRRATRPPGPPPPATDPLEGTDTDALLEDLLEPSHSLTTLAQIHNLRLADVARWFKLEATQSLLADLRRLAEERHRLIELNTRTTALAALNSIAATQGFALDRLRQRAERDATHAERLRDRETVRKAATELLRLNSPSQREGAGGRARSAPATRPAPVPAPVPWQCSDCHAPHPSASPTPLHTHPEAPTSPTLTTPAARAAAQPAPPPPAPTPRAAARPPGS